MTVLEQTPFNTYTASGLSDRFAFTFRILEDEHLQVALDGSLQSLGIDYNLENVTNLGGDVVFTSVPAAGTVVDLNRRTPRDQQVDYAPFDAFPAETHEFALDKLTMIYQERTASNGQGLPLHPSGLFWDAGNLPIRDVGPPSANDDAATKEYVDAQIGSPFDPTADQIITGNWSFDAGVLFNGTAQFNIDPLFAQGLTAGNDRFLAGRNAADNGDIRLAYVGGDDVVRLGDNQAGGANSRVYGNTSIGQYIGLAEIARFVEAADGSLQVDRGDGTFEPVLTPSGIDLSTYTQENVNEVITGSWTFQTETVFQASIRLLNQIQLVGRNAANTASIILARAASDDTARFGSTIHQTVIDSENRPQYTDGSEIGEFTFADLTQAITGQWTFESRAWFDNLGVRFLKNTNMQFQRQDDSIVAGFALDAGDILQMGSSALDSRNLFDSIHDFSQSGVLVARAVARAGGSFLIYDSLGNALKAGFRNPRRIAVGDSDQSTQQNWEGAVVDFSPQLIRTCLVEQLEPTTTCRVLNTGNNVNMLVSAGVGVTLFWYDGSGQRQSTQNFTLAGGSAIELWWASATSVYIFGNGLTP